RFRCASVSVQESPSSMPGAGVVAGGGFAGFFFPEGAFPGGDGDFDASVLLRSGGGSTTTSRNGPRNAVPSARSARAWSIVVPRPMSDAGTLAFQESPLAGTVASTRAPARIVTSFAPGARPE